MKRLIIGIVLCLLCMIPLAVLSQESCCNPGAWYEKYGNYKYDGPVDPGEFHKWKLMEESELCRGRYCCGVYKNPDSLIEVQFITACIDLVWQANTGMGLVKYAYYYNNLLHCYAFTIEDDVRYYKEVPFMEGEDEVVRSILDPYVKAL